MRAGKKHIQRQKKWKTAELKVEYKIKQTLENI